MEEAAPRGHTVGQPEIYPYPTVSPRVVVVPILSCIFGFPVLVMLVICGLRYRAQRARMRAKRNRGREEEGADGVSDGRDGHGRGVGPYISISQYEDDTGNFYQSTTMRALSLKGFGRGDGGLAVRAISETDLDTVVEERSDYDLSEMTSSEYIHTPADTPPHMITYI